MFTRILRQEYEGLLRDMMRDTRRMFYSYYSTPEPMDKYVQRQLKMDPLPHERLKSWTKRMWWRYHPVVMTAHKRDELGSDYY